MAGARRKQAVAVKAKAKGASKKVKPLNKAALGMVAKNVEEIAQTLCDSAVRGNVRSAEKLLELAGEDVGAEEAMDARPLFSWADALAAEPPWQGEMKEAAAETGVGSREPEGA